MLTGVDIRSTDDIAVYSINRSPHSKDATLVLPTDALDRDYVIAVHKPQPYYITTTGIVGVTNNTVIAIEIPPSNLNRTIVIEYNNQQFRNNDSFTVTLNAYETLQLKSVDDICGLKMTSNDASFGVISGSTYMPSSATPATDTMRIYGHIEEQAIPISAWGTHFIAVPFNHQNGSGGDVFKIVALHENTSIDITTDCGSTVVALQSCQAVDVDHTDHLLPSSYVAITSSHPVAVLQYYCSSVSATSSSCDQYLVTIPSLEQEETEYIFSSADDTPEMITLVMNSAHAHGLVIDGTSVDASADDVMMLSINQASANANYTAFRLPMRSGNHNITNMNRDASLSAISQSSPIGLKLDVAVVTADGYDVSSNDAYTVAYESGESGGGDDDSSQDSDSAPLAPDVIAIIVTLVSAVFFVIVVIVGFVLSETVCKDGGPCRGGGKVAPYNIT